MGYLSVREAAAGYGLSPRRLQQLCKEGTIEGAVKVKGSWKILAESIPGKTGAARLPLPVGISGYREAVKSYYYVDKTLLIRDFLDTLPGVSLFTRPRRFGKTLNMDMLRVFFEKTEEDTSVWFRDKAIWSCGAKYQSYQGQYPVISLSFKDIKYPTWEQAREALLANIRNEFARHLELSESACCNPVEREYYAKMLQGQINEVELSRSLAVLSAMLKKHYGKGAVILIDEYDTPIQEGYLCGYYDAVIGLIRNLFSGAFKDNPALSYGFMTGILRVAKESIFSGLNNLKVNTILEDRYSSYFGFTGGEVRDMLCYYGREEKAEEICRWYDGYRFGNTEIFNPWSVINYLDEDCTPKAYWQSTGSNAIIGDIIARATPEISEDLRKLMQGESITAMIDTDVIYPDIRRNPSGIYSFLLVTGYLKTIRMTVEEGGCRIGSLAIPNQEIRFVYAKEIIGRMAETGTESTAVGIRNAIYRKDSGELAACIRSYLLQTISFYDGCGENFYHGLMLGLCAVLNNRYRVLSNREAGYGRFDIQLQPLQEGLPGFLFELKASRKAEESLEELARSALSQIEEKAYGAEMQARGVGEILAVGIAFRGKEIAVKSSADR